MLTFHEWAREFLDSDRIHFETIVDLIARDKHDTDLISYGENKSLSLY